MVTERGETSELPAKPAPSTLSTLLSEPEVDPKVEEAVVPPPLIEEAEAAIYFSL
jgi:hypothetical protein